jgi:G3E family GTPase
VLGDELDRTLIDLVRATPELAAIVLETTGVAEPLPIAWALRREPVRDHVRLAAVVTLVDATSFRASRPRSAAVDAQAAYADVLLVTKAELAGEAETHAAIEAARSLAPRAIVRIGTTDEHAAWLEQQLADPPVEPERALDSEPDHDHEHDITSIWIEANGELDLEELEDQLAELPGDYVRIKGIVRAADEAGEVGWYAVHRVGLRVSSEPLAGKPEAWPHDGGRLVALGNHLDPAALLQCVTASRR